MTMFADVTAAGVLGMPNDVPASAQKSTMPGIARSAGPGSLSHSPVPWSPDSPLFWFAGLALVTFGLVAVSTSVRIGPGRASVSVGKP